MYVRINLFNEKVFSQLYAHIAGIIIEGPRNVTYIPGQTSLPIEQICNVTGFPSWRVNGTLFTTGHLLAGNIEGHSANGANIVINVPMNDTEYICISNVVGSQEVTSPPAFLYIAGEYVNACSYYVHVKYVPKTTITYLL